ALLSGAVSYIAGRSSVLCGTFYFTAVYVFLKSLDSERRLRRLALFGLTAVCGLLAWEAKQEAIALPLFLAAVVFLRAEKKNWRWIAVLSAIPLVAVLLLLDQIKLLYGMVVINGLLVYDCYARVMAPNHSIVTYVTCCMMYSIS